MSSSEVARWQAYERLEPWGEERGDLRNGILAALVANLTRGQGQKAYGPADFMPDYEPKEEEARAPAADHSLAAKALRVFSLFKTKRK